ncbi:hypothetical protein SEA_TAJ14_2 [Arthrobacter phage Taj14]|nr:hypothetical protein SEA_TAJ14_2 [Arthrobacter phage Taj14]
MVDWIFLAVIVAGSIFLVLIPDIWRVAFIESALGRWFDSWFTKLADGLARAWHWLICKIKGASS